MTDGPIFILGSQRGGTNQVLNILRSHPDTCWPDGEFHEVLRPRRLGKDGPLVAARKIWAYAPTLLSAGDILSPHRAPPSEALSGRFGRSVKAALDRATRANSAGVRRHKEALMRRGFYPGGVAPMNRMLVKLVNYNVGFAAELARLYPDAVFVGLIRHAFGACEGRMARGADLEQAMAGYIYMCERLIALEAQGVRIRTFRFEDLIEDTVPVVRAIFAACDLEPEATLGLRLQDKERVHDAQGNIVGINKTDAFYALEDAGGHMRPDVNARASSRLADDAKARITERCRPLLAHFGYAL